MHRFQIYLIVILLAIVAACSEFRRTGRSQTNSETDARVTVPQATPISIPVSDGFDYPVGDRRKVSQAKDGDGWYNAQDFGENNHLGEDWNGEAGGNTDCGLPVYAASKGTIIFAGEAGPGWGKVVIVRHKLPDNTLVETLYGHLRSLDKTGGEVERHERIASIGDADGAYPCHLHFEVRLYGCPSWGLTGPGYSDNRAGWTDPSDFVDARRNLSLN